jgi:N-hydroxyarylamine O-acetyltransferase
MLNVSAYLDRINYAGSREPSADTLRALHRAHMLSVPFENLDIHIGRPILCDEDAFLHKIINQRRGGFCYELNGAFAAILRALGFDVTLLSARVANPDGSYGHEFDHLALRVDLPAAPRASWLADVGFGDSFLEPLLLQPNVEQSQSSRAYRLSTSAGKTRIEKESEGESESESGKRSVFYLEVMTTDKPEEESLPAAKWKRLYSFTLQPRSLIDFAPMCRYHQTSPESHFTRQRIATLATPEGRITLSDRKLIETRNGIRQERNLAGDSQWRTALRNLLKIDLPA